MAKKPASGMYKTKARNLTDAQLKRAKAQKAATKRTVSISNTTRATSGENKGYTLGPGGKRLTGTVVMADGDRAVYKGGKRVTNVPKSSMKDKTPTRGITSRTSSSSSSATAKPKSASAGLTSAQKAKIAKDKKLSTGTSRATVSRGQSAASSRYSRMGKSNVPSSLRPSASSSSKGTGKKWWQAGGGGLVGPNSPVRGGGSTSSKPKKGDRRRKGSYGGFETYDGSRWVSSK